MSIRGGHCSESINKSIKNLELPLQNGFRRALVTRGSDKILSVYYITPDNKFLKNISEVCNWIRDENQEHLFESRNFNFITRKYTIHESEFIMDYSLLPQEIRDSMIQKKKSIAPIIVTVHGDDTFSIKRESSNNVNNGSETDTTIISPTELKGESVNESEMEDITTIASSVTQYLSNTLNEGQCEDDPIIQTDIQDNDKSMSSSEMGNNPVTPIETQNSSIDIQDGSPTKMQDYITNVVSIKKECIVERIKPHVDIMHLKRSCSSNDTSSDDDIPLSVKPEHVLGTETIIPTKRMKLDDMLQDSDDNSMTLSIDSICADNSPANVVLKPRHPFQYPLADVNMTSTVELGSNSHIDSLQEHFNGNIDLTILRSLKTYCGNHCAYDNKGCPRIAFECDVCLIVWHNDCIGHRWLTAGPMTLIICDNCYLLHLSLKLDLPNIFCDIDKVLQTEFRPDMNITPTSISIPMKLESIFKLCKVLWMLQTKKKPNNAIKLQKKPLSKLSQDFPKDCKYFVKVLIREESIIRYVNEDHIMLKFNLKEVDIMSRLFADPGCEMLLEDTKYSILSSKISAKYGELRIPIEGKIMSTGYAIFYTYESGQENRSTYMFRTENLRKQMNDTFVIPKQKPQSNIIFNQFVEATAPKFTKKLVSGITGHTKNKITLLPSKQMIVSTTGQTSKFPPVFLQNLPKNVIPISRDQIKNISNVIKIRQRKQDFTGQKTSVMVTNSSKTQYYNLVDLPFSVLEKILTSKCLTTMDKLNCRLANRVLKCVIDAGVVWKKAVIDPAFVTGLQTMFDFLSQRNVRCLKFILDFQDSFGIEFFTSFISRLKLYPESFSLDKISVKMSGLSNISSRFILSIQDIICATKSLKELSLSSNIRTVIGLSRDGREFSSNTLETLKLKNIDNISQVMRTDIVSTPKLRNLRCGDWSLVLSIDILSLMHVTNLRLDFSEYVSFTDVMNFSQLTSLETLIISRPLINEILIDFLGYILNQKSLKYFLLETAVFNKDQLSSCNKFGCYFPAHIAKIRWNIFLNTFVMLSEPGFEKKIASAMPANVRVRVRDM